ncbi:MAG: succinate dehydrogenase, partial [Chlorobium phaeobacteroides]|nr:succinate dehydrogenase [Chlorobium phaeobacteroides]
MKRYAYYLSCINESMTKEVDKSIDLWQKDLDIDFVKLHESTCCGGSNLGYGRPKHFLLGKGRNMALAGKIGAGLGFSCNTCPLTIRSGKKGLYES